MNTTKGTARILYEFNSQNGHAAVVELDPPIQETDYHGTVSEYEFVVSSAVDLDFGSADLDLLRGIDTCETYLFPARPEKVAKKCKRLGGEDGLILSWTELPGSTKGIKDHDQALRNAGYEVVR